MGQMPQERIVPLQLHRSGAHHGNVRLGAEGRIQEWSGMMKDIAVKMVNECENSDQDVF